MIAFDKYQQAKMEIWLIYFRYNGLKFRELRKSNIILETDEFLKKWCYEIPSLRKTRRCLKSELKSNEAAKSEKEKLNIYKNYLEYIFTELYTINLLRTEKKATKITSKIIEGMEKYYYNHY